jgi:DNA-directed RNA polymerase specialized sigma24 family protein
VVNQENPKFTYEDKSDEIDLEVRKRKGKWFLDSLAWFDFEDVEQIIKAHIHKKWHQWDQSRSLKPWINKIITNQMKNILRNNYSNFVRPCLNCPFNQSCAAKDGGESSLCGFTKSGLQDSTCPLYAKWERTKKPAYLMEAQKKLNEHMKNELSQKQYQVYDLLFVQHLDEEDVARKMGYKTTEKGRKAGYKQIKNLKKIFKQKAQDILKREDIISVGSTILWS